MLNDVTIRNLPAPERGVKQYPDGKIPGFGVRITSKAMKSFYLTYRFQGKSKRINLGRYPVITLQKARTKAHTALVELSEGRDPRGETPEQEQAKKFTVAIDRFIETHCLRNNRPNTAAETARLLNRHFRPVWNDRELDNISRRDIVALLEPIMAEGKQSTARHAFAAIRKFFNWTVEQGILEDSPCRNLKSPGKAGSRDRVLSKEELLRIWLASGKQKDSFSTIIRLLILTAQRRGEVTAMAWDEIDFEQRLWTLPGDRTKNARGHAIPLSDTAITILQSIPRTVSPFVFPARGKPDRFFSGHSKCKRALDAAAELDGWTLHDLRRTAATGMAQLDIEPHIIESVLNHTSGTFGGVAGVYNRYKYIGPMREALSLWDKHIQKLVADG